MSTSTIRQLTSLWTFLCPWAVETPPSSRFRDACIDVCEGHALNFSHSVQMHLLSSMHDTGHACFNFLTLSTFFFLFVCLSLIPLYSCTLELHLIFGFIYFLSLFCFFVSLAHPKLSIYLFLLSLCVYLILFFKILNFIIMSFLVSYFSISSLLDFVLGIFMSSISLLHIFKIWCPTS